MRKVLIFLTFLLISIAVVPAVTTAAQNIPAEETPVVQMLSRIPSTIEARADLSYIDYQAIITSREGMPEFNTYEELDAAFRAERGYLVMAALNGVQSGPSFLQNLMQSQDMPEVMGFDFFDIQQAVSFGKPPAELFMIQGEFDASAVVAAHEARGFTQDEENDITLLCGEVGCENGNQYDLQDINPSNLFGGKIGRSQPTLVTDTWIASSPDLASIDAVADTEVEDSLAEHPDYRSAVEALEQDGTLIQSWFLMPSDVPPPSVELNERRQSDEVIEKLAARMEKEFVPIPAWNLAVLADVLTETEQQAIVALVYTSQADAEAAAAQFPERFTNAQSMVAAQTFSEILADRGMTSADVSVYPSTRDRYVVLVTLNYPLPSPEPVESGGGQASSLVYGVLPRAYFARDMAWLAPEF